MKKILFPTDFSPVAGKAFVYALHLANQIGASITTLHAYVKPDVGNFVMPMSLFEFREGLGWNEFENYQDSIPSLRQVAVNHNLGNVPINHALEEGETVDVITKVAKQENYDLIVMGTSGASVLKDIFIGTFSGKVIENSQCPVIVVPHNAVFEDKIDKIGVTIDYSEEDKKVLNNILELAKTLGASVEAIHIDSNHIENTTYKIDAFKADYKECHFLNFVELNSNNIVEATADYADKNDIDFLVMVTHKRSFFEKLFSFSHAKKMTYQYEIPVYAIPEALL
jgi:nucleotide-binding universal stress UspA family protein